MKSSIILLGAIMWIGQASTVANAQQDPKNEISKVRQDRKDDHTVRQVTPDPKKSPAKHADNLSKNTNHEMNRSSKKINKTFQKNRHNLAKSRNTDHTTRQVTPSPNKSPGKHTDNLSKNVNHEANRESKDVNHSIKSGTQDLHDQRKTDHTTKQVTPDPKKSPGKHADNLSKNVNHEVNRASKDINHALSGKK